MSSKESKRHASAKYKRPWQSKRRAFTTWSRPPSTMKSLKTKKALSITKSDYSSDRMMIFGTMASDLISEKEKKVAVLPNNVTSVYVSFRICSFCAMCC